MKSLLSFTVIFLSLILITSCSEDKISAPVITAHEIGHENSKSVAQGEELHLDIEIVADGKISSIKLELHPEEEHLKDDHAHWELDTTFTTEFEGLKNAEFHKHFDVPAEAELGAYHMHFVVNDQEGNQSSIEEEITVTASE